MKKILCALLSLCILFLNFSVLAEILPDGASAFFMPEEEMNFTAKLDIEQLLPYGQEMLDSLNTLLPHLSMDVSYGNDCQKLSFCVDGEEAAEFTVESSEEGYVMTTPMLENRRILSSESPFSTLFSDAESTIPSFHLYQAVTEAKKAIPALYEAIAPVATSKKANYNIKNVGKGLWVHIVKLTPEQSAGMYNELCALLFAGLSSDYTESLNGMVFQKALTVALYRAEENGDILAAYISGKVKHPNGKIYALNYLYAYSGKAESYKLELGKGKKGGVGITALLKEKIDDQSYSLDSDYSASFRSADGNTLWTETDTVQLEGKNKSGIRSLSGKMTYCLVTDSDSKTSSSREYTPDLCMEDTNLTGSIGVKIFDGKNTVSEVRVLLTKTEKISSRETGSEDSSVSVIILGQEDDAATSGGNSSGSPTDPVAPPVQVNSYEAPAEEIDIHPDSFSQEEKEELLDELYQNTAAHLLAAILKKVPAEDLKLFSDNTNADEFAALVERH